MCSSTRAENNFSRKALRSEMLCGRGLALIVFADLEEFFGFEAAGVDESRWSTLHREIMTAPEPAASRLTSCGGSELISPCSTMSWESMKVWFR